VSGVLDPGGAGSYDGEDELQNDYERPTDDGVAAEIRDVLDPTTSASDRTEWALRTNPLTAPAAVASDLAEVAAGEDVTDTTGAEAGAGVAEDARDAAGEATDVVRHTTTRVVESTTDAVVPDLPDWLGPAGVVMLVVTVLAALAVAFGQLVTVEASA